MSLLKTGVVSSHAIRGLPSLFKVITGWSGNTPFEKGSTFLEKLFPLSVDFDRTISLISPLNTFLHETYTVPSCATVTAVLQHGQELPSTRTFFSNVFPLSVDLAMYVDDTPSFFSLPSSQAI